MVSRDRKQKTVKAFEQDIALINEQAKHLRCTAAELIHAMCEELRKQLYLQELGESFDLMRSDNDAYAKFKEEQEVWDCALSDGLDDAP